MRLRASVPIIGFAVLLPDARVEAGGGRAGWRRWRVRAYAVRPSRLFFVFVRGSGEEYHRGIVRLRSAYRIALRF